MGERRPYQTCKTISDCNWTRTHNHLVRKRTLNHLAKLASLVKWLNVRLRTKWVWFRVQLQSLKLQISRLLRARSSLTFRQLVFHYELPQQSRKEDKRTKVNDSLLTFIHKNCSIIKHEMVPCQAKTKQNNKKRINSLISSFHLRFSGYVISKI